MGTYIINIADSTQEVIEYAIKNPEKTPNEEEVLIYLKPIFSKLKKQYGESSILDFLDGNYNKLSTNELASIMISYYKEVYASGIKSCGIIMRYSHAQ